MFESYHIEAQLRWIFDDRCVEGGMVRTLRLTQGIEGDGHWVEVALEGDGTRQVAVARFTWELRAQDREDIRWYLEDYLLYPIEPAPMVAARVERRITELGRELFGKVFEANKDPAPMACGQ
jgi:hypothetical protein